MIPLKLILSGFLSYRDRVELDFSGFDLACISGPNGAGKSSLLDAITWALFGQARRRDDALINSHPEVKAAEVIFLFEYEGNIYRIQRSNPRGKNTLLEFHIQQNPEQGAGKPGGNYTALSANWKPLTEHSVRETQARIEQILRLDYETFVNASFFLQGKADQFTQQRPGDRKRILGSILGLEDWEVYRQRAADQRKDVETQISSISGRLQEINAELNEEESRKARLNQLQAELSRLAQTRAAHETIVASFRKTMDILGEQRRWVENLARQMDGVKQRMDNFSLLLEARQREKNTYADLVKGWDGKRDIQEAVKAATTDLQEARLAVERWDEVAASFREQEKLRQAPLDEINAERARLEQEAQMLQAQRAEAENQMHTAVELQEKLQIMRASLLEVENKLSQRVELEAQLNEGRRRQAEARAENPRLRQDMDELKAHLDQLKTLEGDGGVERRCPFCGQVLSEEDRLRLVELLQSQGQAMGDKFRANQAYLRDSEQAVNELESTLGGLSKLEPERLNWTQLIAQNEARREGLLGAVDSWERQGAPRLAAIQLTLAEETFAAEARRRLTEIDAELRAIGYDAAAHDAARRLQAERQAAEAKLREVEKAAISLAALEREIATLIEQQKALQADYERQREEYSSAASRLAEAEAQAPDLYAAEMELLNLQEQENRLRLEVGAAQQKVLILGDLRTRQKNLSAERETLSVQVSLYKQLERAFGKDGVPAMLIEQALPEIEERANHILDRLSGGGMSVRFITQAAYKDKRREDLRETLDIHISDSYGTREYEMYSGGEAFRINFAIRLALSELLAQRAGARLQMLFIDEGFGSQDAWGRQRLVEAINLVHQDFAKILVITHVDELKDAFPSLIEVEKTPRGSTVHITR